MIAGQGATNDGYSHFSADLPDDVTDPDPDIADEHLVLVLRSPDEMVAMMQERVTAVAVRHSWYPQGSETSRPSGVLTSLRIPAIGRAHD